MLSVSKKLIFVNAEVSGELTRQHLHGLSSVFANADIYYLTRCIGLRCQLPRFNHRSVLI